MPKPLHLPRRALLGGGAAIAGGALVAPFAAKGRVARDAVPAPRGAPFCVGARDASAVAAREGPPRAPLHPDALASFVDPLPVPRVLSPVDTRDGVARYRLSMRESEARVHRDLPPTRVRTYDGSTPGPTIEARAGAPIAIEWSNDLPREHLFAIDRTICGADGDDARAVAHVHGAKVPPESDGYPEDWLARGASRVATYPLAQDAATLWYHDHAMGLERLNQYAGLFGAFFVRDAIDDGVMREIGIAREHEIPIVLSDRLFFADGQLRYPTSGDPRAPWVAEVFGDAPLVNGALRPFVEVEPRAYRLRVINASNARPFAIAFDDRPIDQIGADQGLLPAPARARRVTIAPGERVDLVVDFSDAAGGASILRASTVPLAQFRVKRAARVAPRPIPARLRPMEPLDPRGAAVTRTLTLGEYHDAARGRMLMLLDGKYWRDPVSERPLLGSTEVWRFVNMTEDTHPIHLHLVRFLVLDRQLFDADEYATSGRMELLGAPTAPDPSEAGWKDTVRCEPGMITRIVARFDGWPGRYVWHCHVLEHAANEMMRPFEVKARG